MMGDAIEMHVRNIKSRDNISMPRTSTHTKSDVEQDGLDAVINIMGRRQEMHRNFGSLSILALSVTLLASWESIASTFAPALLNGGPAALVWGMLLSISGTMALALSFAEMASICPIAGAQYHWTALFAPPKIRNFITWMQGSITVFAWQATCTSICYLVATQIQGLLVLNYPDYIFRRWHGTLLSWAIILFTFMFNVYGIKILPFMQLVGGIFHVMFFVVLIVPLVLLSSRSTPEFVFTQLLNEGGWKSDGISWCIGMLTVTYCFLGFDGAIHMSEEVRNPSIVVPKILVQTIAINGSLSLIFVIVLLFCTGNIERDLNTPTGYAIIEIFYQTTGSVRAATAMQALIATIGLSSNLAVVASVSRLTWAFARDGGLPYSSFFAHIDKRHHVPYRAICIVCVMVMLLTIINIFSSTALNAILALATTSLYVSYIIPIILLVMKRIRVRQARNGDHQDAIIFGPWSLGRWGMAINIYAIVFGIFVCIFVPFPPIVPVTAENMNYCGPVFLGLILLLCLDWLVRGKKTFTGPVLNELLKLDER